jgi:histidinol-phosphate aminotransferase
MAGAVSVQVPLLPDERHDLDAMAAAVTERTRVIFICSPNNPTGQAVTALELEEFLERVPSDLVVVLDEAYAEFIGDDDIHDGVSVGRRHDNVVLLRTFSKAYGLAGLRVGFSIAHPEVTEALRKTALPFGVSSIAEEAALVSLEAEDELFERVHALVNERRRVTGALQEQGWELHPSFANFVWLRLGDLSAEFAAACEEQGITVRTFPGEGVRVTVAETEANDRFIEVAHKFRLALR